MALRSWLLTIIIPTMATRRLTRLRWLVASSYACGGGLMLVAAAGLLAAAGRHRCLTPVTSCDHLAATMLRAFRTYLLIYGRRVPAIITIIIEPTHLLLTRLPEIAANDRCCHRSLFDWRLVTIFLYRLVLLLSGHLLLLRHGWWLAVGRGWLSYRCRACCSSGRTAAGLGRRRCHLLLLYRTSRHACDRLATLNTGCSSIGRRRLLACHQLSDQMGRRL